MDLAERHDLWVAMAELFLDSETRTRIPQVAGRCLRAGLAPDEARKVWRHEVTPAVWWNLWTVAGEWGLWPRERLVPRIEARRRRVPNPGWGSSLRYWATAWMIDPQWRAVEHCLEAFAASAPPEAARLEVDLVWLARVFFDFMPKPRPETRAPIELHRVYVTTFLPIFTPLVVENKSSGESLKVCRKRVDEALSPLPQTDPYRS